MLISYIGVICSIGATQSMLKDYTYSAKSRMITPYSMLTALPSTYVHVWKDKVIP